MKKKGYIAPHTEEYKIEALQLLEASKFDKDSDSQDIIPSDDEPYEGEFSMPGLLDII